MLVILSGVSGAGKDTIKKELIKRMENVISLPSFTSREMRPGEIEGDHYHFISKEEFEKLVLICKKMSDEEKIRVKNKIRDEIFRNRFRQ